MKPRTGQVIARAPLIYRAYICAYVLAEHGQGRVGQLHFEVGDLRHQQRNPAQGLDVPRGAVRGGDWPERPRLLGNVGLHKSHVRLVRECRIMPITG